MAPQSLALASLCFAEVGAAEIVSRLQWLSVTIKFDPRSLGHDNEHGAELEHFANSVQTPGDLVHVSTISDDEFRASSSDRVGGTETRRQGHNPRLCSNPAKICL
jgi:hypothetical protein